MNNPNFTLTLFLNIFNYTRQSTKKNSSHEEEIIDLFSLKSFKKISPTTNINSTEFKFLQNETIFFQNNSNIIVNYLNNSNYSNNEPDSYFYFYGTLPLIFFCILSVAINIKILLSVYWIRRPLSPTLHISLSLTGADAFSSFVLGVGLVMNSFVPKGLGIKLTGIFSNHYFSKQRNYLIKKK